MTQRTRLPWIVSFLAIACGQAAGQCYWKELDPLGPLAGTTQPIPLSYDSGRGRSVAVDYYSTWEWDGRSWRQPGNWPQGEAVALAYDSLRGVTIGFGGEGPGSPSPLHNRTYEWDGTAWTERLGAAPPARRDHALAFDPVRGRTVLFGGRNVSGTLGDTWEFDGTAWHLAGTSGPSARSLHSLVFDTARGRVVLLGGLSQEATALGDVWEWNGVAWNPGVSGPPARFASVMAFDPSRAKIVLFGGRAANGQLLNDVWESDGAAWTPQPPAAAPPRVNAGGAFDIARSQLLVLGGFTNGLPRDFWVREASGSWTQLAGRPRPSERSSHAMAYDTWRRRSIIDGGSMRRDHWELDGLLWTQRFNVSPQPGYHAGLAFDEARGVTVSYGGMLSSSSTAPGQTWEFNGDTWVQRTIPGPPSRRYPAMAYDSARARMVMTGGREVPEPFAELTDTWEYDGASWQQTAAFGPGGGAMAYDRRRAVMVLFSWSGELWEYDGVGWQQRAYAAGPLPGTYEIAYDAARAVTVLMGHADQSYAMRTWEWNGDQWREGAGALALLRSFHALSYDSDRGRIVLYGGLLDVDDLRANDTWELVCPCYSNCDGSVVYPTLNVADFTCFLNAFAAGLPYANCDASTTVPILNVQDFSCFLNSFASGCP